MGMPAALDLNFAGCCTCTFTQQIFEILGNQALADILTQ